MGEVVLCGCVCKSLVYSCYTVAVSWEVGMGFRGGGGGSKRGNNSRESDRFDCAPLLRRAKFSTERSISLGTCDLSLVVFLLTG